MLIGFLLAFATSILIAMYIVPRKLAKSSPPVFTGLVSAGVLLVGIAGALLGLTGAIPVVTMASTLRSIPIGLLWGLGYLFLMSAIDRLGVARSNQWKSLQGPIGTLLALFLLGELAKVSLLSTLGAALLVFLSALALTIPTGTTVESKLSDRRGIFLALGGALTFGFAAAYTKTFAASADTTSLALGSGVGFFIMAMLGVSFLGKSMEMFQTTTRERILPAVAGIIFALGTWGMALTFRYIPVSIGYTIIQLSTVWVVLTGIFIFREIDFGAHRLRITLGIACALCGVLLLLLH